MNQQVINQSFNEILCGILKCTKNELSVIDESIMLQVNNKNVIVTGNCPISLGSIVNIALYQLQKKCKCNIDRTNLSFVKQSINVPDHIRLSVPDEELIELNDRPEVLLEAVRYLADCIRQKQHNKKHEFVVHTGAGISTAAKIPDFRGPNGVWTNRDRGLKAPKSIPMEIAEPTYTHISLVIMQNEKVLDYLVSQNVDGLHRRSGIKHNMISELHGNCFKEACADCNAEYLRTFDVCRHRGKYYQNKRDFKSQSGISHITGRKCEKCDGMLRDSIIHFRENLPEKDLELAIEHSYNSVVSLCIGTSLHVTPAADLPDSSKLKNHKLFIINLQSTGKDEEALHSGGCLMHAKCDEAVKLLMKELELEVNISSKNDEEKENNVMNTNIKVDDVSGKKNAHFFQTLGLPPTLTQLPSQLYIVQSHELLKNADLPHQWSIHVELPKEYPLDIHDIIDKVEYDIHPSFQPNHIVKKNAPFMLGPYFGWGTFEVTSVIHLQDGLIEKPIIAHHQLNFDKPETRNEVKIPPMKLSSGFKDTILQKSGSLRPTQTRVRRFDGSTYIEERTN